MAQSGPNSWSGPKMHKVAQNGPKWPRPSERTWMAQSGPKFWPPFIALKILKTHFLGHPVYIFNNIMVVTLYFRWNKRAATVSPPSPFWKEDEEISWEQVLKRATVMCQYFRIENQFEIERASEYFSIENQFEIERASAYFWNSGTSALAPSPKRVSRCRYTFGI